MVNRTNFRMGLNIKIGSYIYNCNRNCNFAT